MRIKRRRTLLVLCCSACWFVLYWDRTSWSGYNVQDRKYTSGTRKHGITAFSRQPVVPSKVGNSAYNQTRVSNQRCQGTVSNQTLHFNQSGISSQTTAFNQSRIFYRSHVISTSLQTSRDLIKLKQTIFPGQCINNLTVNKAKEELSQSVAKIPPLQRSPEKFLPPQYEPMLYGNPRHDRGFLTIGILSVRRPLAEDAYLLQTLASILNQTTSGDKQEVTLVVMLSDDNPKYSTLTAKKIMKTYPEHVNSGFIRIICPPSYIYPNFKHIGRTYADSFQRLKWRAKQNIDYAYLIHYCVNISEYYLQLEDDVVCARNFVSHIRHEVDRRNKITKSTRSRWFMLEFSRLGFIGKLFRSIELLFVSDILLRLYDTQPGDLMLGKLLKMKIQLKPIHSERSLFQHVGKFSTLKNKIMPVIDEHFKDIDNMTSPPIMQLPKGDNPEAAIFTDFEAADGYPAVNAYDQNQTTFFWATRAKRNQKYQLTFTKQHNFSRIIISTGDIKRKTDSLCHSYVAVAPKLYTPLWKGNHECGTFKRLADFVEGEVDTKAMGVVIPDNVLCLKIVPKLTSKTCVKIREIVLMY